MFGGSGGGTFGSNTTGAFGGSSGFGSKPAFGTPATTSAGTGMFGGGTTTATAGGTGFGSGFGGATTTSSTPFGGGGTSLFGGAKPATTGFGAGTPAFGAGTGTTGGGLFGGGAGTTGFGAAVNPGIGTNIGDPPGTAVVAFSPTVEKEPNNTSQSNSFQNILFMDAYKKWSADELRLTDYNQGRKTGSTGGTGAFGGSNFGGGTTGFGANTTGTSFGANTGTGMFGGTQPAATGFGAANTTTAGFGAGAGGGLFGAKPATGGMFGSTPTTQPAQTGGIFGGGGTGAFGGGNTTTTGFGANTANTGGGLFGGANAAAPKTTGFSFGNTGAGTGTSAFGGAATTSGFGANPPAANTGTGGLFGNTSQTNTTGGGLFGGQQQQQQQQPAATGTGFGGTGFGGQAQNTGGGLFGNQQQQQQKPGGLFGTSTTNTGTGGGLFGGANTGTTGFGGTNTAQPAGGGLFGNKPAGTGGSLFGGNAPAQQGNTGGGLFGNLGGNTQNQQPAQGGLFGGLGQNQQAKPSLFGGAAPSGGSLFGNQPAQQQGGGLFGASTNQQQPQQGMLGNSLLGASQGQQMPQQAFNASIHDISAYGAATLFSGLPDDKIQNPGPLATPLSGKSKVKSRSILPMYKLSPANASRFVTPQKRGYGFSYSAYGSPASPSSVSSTPGGFSQSLLAGSINRGLSKSISASNLRRSYNVEDSILQPGAFSANSSMRLLGSAGNHKKLIINKEMRSDLFTSPQKEKQVLEESSLRKVVAKRVSFDTSTVETSPDNRPAALENGSSTDDSGYLKPSSRPSTNGVNGAKSSPTTAAPEVEQVKGNELAIVHEEESPAAVRTEKKPGSAIEPGAYWMSPSIEDIRAMNRMQRQRVSDFTVGRENVGSVTFKIPVDLSNINLDELFDGIVILAPRSATVYPVAAKKPPVGKGLNVPAIISLEHSYPRGGLATTGRRLERHIERLKTAIPDTTFDSYDKETGVWTFSVEHFTTYGLGDDDDDDDETEAESIPARRPILSPSVVKDSTSPSDPDDTFDFKRSRRAVPGAFDDDAALSDNEEVSDTAQRQGTLSPEPQEADAPLPSREWPEDESMADGPDEFQLEAYEQASQQGSVDDQNDPFLSRYADNETQVPAGIMRARMRAFKKSTAPTRIEVAGGDDWTQILQASVRAPRTVDRATLRALNESGAVWDIKDRGSPGPQKNAPVPDGAGFANSIDLMKSLFEPAKGPTQSVQASPAKGFVKVGIPLAS
jgi:nuclear pore complex protein Nup98-Nup96